MARDLNYQLEILVWPILREPDGLALSSRNVYLKPAERQAATVLYRALSAAKRAFEGGERDAGELKMAMGAVLAGEPLAQADYVSAADPETLAELTTITKGVLLSLAVKIGTTRLIDNFLLPD